MRTNSRAVMNVFSIGVKYRDTWEGSLRKKVEHGAA